VPFFGYYAADEKTPVRLFQTLAEQVVKKNPVRYVPHGVAF